MSDLMQRLTRSRVQLLIKQPFFGTLAMKMRVSLTEEIKTFAVDGKDMYVNPGFLASLPDDQVIGVTCHEILHIANCHHLRRGDRDPKIWNMACDYAINPIVLEANLALPEGGLVDPRFRGMYAERIYDILLQELPPPPTGEGGQPDDKQGDGGFGEVLDGDRRADGGRMTESERALAENEVRMQVAEAAQSARQQGKLPASVQKMIGDILRPSVNWRDVLRRFITNTFAHTQTWAKPNRKLLARGIRLPGMLKENLGPLVIAIDTSGSIYADEEATEKFLSEVDAICRETKPEEVHVVFCDANIAAVEMFEHGDLGEVLPRLKQSLKGGGGTDFCPVFNWVEDNNLQPAALIYLTDMEGRFPKAEPMYPVLWAKTTDHAAPFGDSVRIN
jgi:predicted metal-dependent peptidase